MLGTKALSPGGLDWKKIVACFGEILKRKMIRLNVAKLAPKNDISQMSMIGADRLF
tara:strand:+ start:1170 stop:1337 length:168 start_codon:yes stop_codon:yes gene_type:complete